MAHYGIGSYGLGSLKLSAKERVGMWWIGQEPRISGDVKTKIALAYTHYILGCENFSPEALLLDRKAFYKWFNQMAQAQALADDTGKPKEGDVRGFYRDLQKVFGIPDGELEFLVEHSQNLNWAGLMEELGQNSPKGHKGYSEAFKEVCGMMGHHPRGQTVL